LRGEAGAEYPELDDDDVREASRVTLAARVPDEPDRAVCAGGLF
jgi:hypothetical protein